MHLVGKIVIKRSQGGGQVLVHAAFLAIACHFLIINPPFGPLPSSVWRKVSPLYKP